MGSEIVMSLKVHDEINRRTRRRYKYKYKKEKEWSQRRKRRAGHEKMVVELR
jgi:hypothetical protein